MIPSLDERIVASSDYDSTYDSTYETNHSDSSDFAQNDDEGEGSKKPPEVRGGCRECPPECIVLHTLLPSPEVNDFTDFNNITRRCRPLEDEQSKSCVWLYIHRQDKSASAPESPVMPCLEPLMSQLNNWNFPIFSLVEKTHGKTGCILSQVKTICVAIFRMNKCNQMKGCKVIEMSTFTSAAIFTDYWDLMVCED